MNAQRIARSAFKMHHTREVSIQPKGRCVMKFSLFASLGLMLLLAGCNNNVARNPLTGEREAPLVAERNRLSELPPAPGTAPRVVADGGEVVIGPKVAVETAASYHGGLDPYMRYDTTTERTIRGPILGLERVPLTGDRTGLFVKINDGGEFPLIYVGPEEWLFTHDITPSMTEQIFATGSRVVVGDQIVILARKVLHDGVEIDLRDRDGNPRWTEPVTTERATE
jgi:hypothetical protein